MKNIKISRAFTYAKENLWDGKSNKASSQYSEKYICHALSASKKFGHGKSSDTDGAIKIIDARLDGMSMERFLVEKKILYFDIKEYRYKIIDSRNNYCKSETFTIIQSHRMAWLDSLIKEFGNEK